MNNTHYWPRQLAWLALTVLLGAAIGALADLAMAGAAGGAILWALIWLRQARRLMLWLDSGIEEPPEARGVWGAIFDGLYHLHRRDREERERLEAAAEYLREALSSLSQAVVMVDAAGAIQWCNQSATRLLGLRWPEDEHQVISHLVRDPQFVRYFNGGRYAEPLEMTSPQDDKITLQFEITGFGEGNRLVFGTDITKIKRLEQMRVDFIANVSHELRTPLTVLSGYIETLNDVPEIDPRVAKALGQMKTQSVRMETLVADLMWLSRLESVPLPRQSQPLHVASLVNALVTEAKVKIGAGKHFVVETDENLRLLGQEKEIHSAFNNLIVNACKYTPGDGQVTIRWGMDERGNGIFAVSDTGIGIAKEHLPRLTERFYRVDKSRSIATGGTGLGLAIVKHVLLRHHARLDVTSTVAEGSTFRCIFPPEQLVRADRNAAGV